MINLPPGLLRPFHQMSISELKKAEEYWAHEREAFDNSAVELRKVMKALKTARSQGKVPRQMEKAARIWRIQREAEYAALLFASPAPSPLSTENQKRGRPAVVGEPWVSAGVSRRTWYRRMKGVGK